MNFVSNKKHLKLVKLFVLPGVLVGLTAASEPKKVEFDIAGIQLGSSLEETLKHLKTAGYVSDVEYLSFRFDPDAKYPLKIIAEKDSDNENVKSDKMVLHMTYPPSQPVVGSIYREIRYSSSKAPFMKSYFDAAKKKAGGEFYRLRPSAYLGNYYGEQLIKWNSKGKVQGGFLKILNNASMGKTVDRCILAYPRMTFDEVAGLDTYDGDYMSYNSPARDFGPKENCNITYIGRFLPSTKGPVAIAKMLLVDQKKLAKNNRDFHKFSRSIEKVNVEAQKRDQIAPDI